MECNLDLQLSYVGELINTSINRLYKMKIETLTTINKTRNNEVQEIAIQQLGRFVDLEKQLLMISQFVQKIAK